MVCNIWTQDTNWTAFCLVCVCADNSISVVPLMLLCIFLSLSYVFSSKSYMLTAFVVLYKGSSIWRLRKAQRVSVGFSLRICFLFQPLRVSSTTSDFQHTGGGCGAGRPADVDRCPKWRAKCIEPSGTRTPPPSNAWEEQWKPAGRVPIVIKEYMLGDMKETAGSNPEGFVCLACEVNRGERWD